MSDGGGEASVVFEIFCIDCYDGVSCTLQRGRGRRLIKSFFSMIGRRTLFLIAVGLTPSLAFQAYQSQSNLSSPTKNNEKRSYVEIVEPESKCNVVLLGCLHGSVSSAYDVRTLIQERSTDVVVLELCASRFADLKRQKEQEATEFAGNGQTRIAPALQRFVSMVVKTNENRGWTTAIAAAILSGASGLQSGLSGFRPGLEFTVASDVSEELDCDIVLADRAVDETLRRMGTLPSISLEMMTETIRNHLLNPSKSSLGQAASALSTAVFGDDSMNRQEQVRMSTALTRNREVIRDLLRVTLPVVLLAQVVAVLANAGLGFLDKGELELSSPFLLYHEFSLTFHDLLSLATAVASDLVAATLLLSAGCVAIALPATQVILLERDVYLARGIRKACTIAASTPTDGEPCVVAVLGLLHVNGVAKILLEGAEDSKHP